MGSRDTAHWQRKLEEPQSLENLLVFIFLLSSNLCHWPLSTSSANQHLAVCPDCPSRRSFFRQINQAQRSVSGMQDPRPRSSDRLASSTKIPPRIFPSAPMVNCHSLLLLWSNVQIFFCCSHSQTPHSPYLNPRQTKDTPGGYTESPYFAPRPPQTHTRNFYSAPSAVYNAPPSTTQSLTESEDDLPPSESIYDARNGPPIHSTTTSNLPPLPTFTPDASTKHVPNVVESYNEDAPNLSEVRWVTVFGMLLAFLTLLIPRLRARWDRVNPQTFQKFWGGGEDELPFRRSELHASQVQRFLSGSECPRKKRNDLEWSNHDW